MPLNRRNTLIRLMLVVTAVTSITCPVRSQPQSNAGSGSPGNALHGRPLTPYARSLGALGLNERTSEAADMLRRALDSCEQHSISKAVADGARALDILGQLYGDPVYGDPVASVNVNVPRYYLCLAQAYWQTGLNDQDLAVLKQSEVYFTKAVQAFEAPGIVPGAFGDDWTSMYLVTLSGFGAFEMLYGHYDAAESLYKKALARATASPTTQVGEIRNVLLWLGDLYEREHRLYLSHALYKKALVLAEIGGHDRAGVSATLAQLGLNDIERGNLQDGFEFLKNAVRTSQSLTGSNQDVAFDVRSDLGSAYLTSGNMPDAINILRPLLEDEERSGGGNAPREKDLLSRAYIATGRYDLARQFLGTEASQYNSSFPYYVLYLSDLLQDIAIASLDQGGFEEAESSAQRAVDTGERFRGAVNSELAGPLATLAAAQEARHEFTGALQSVRRATSLILSEYGQVSGEQRFNPEPLRPDTHWILARHISLAAEQAGIAPSTSAELTHETFKLAQVLHNGSVGLALAQMAARFTTRNDELGKLVLQEQAALRGSGQTEVKLTEEFGADQIALSPGEEREAQKTWAAWTRATAGMNAYYKGAGMLRQVQELPTLQETRALIAARKLDTELADTGSKLGSLDDELLNKFPEYADLVSPMPISVEQVQNYLAQDEALIVFLVPSTGYQSTPAERNESFVWTIRRDDSSFRKIPLGKEALADRVAELREVLSPATNPTMDAPFPLDRANSLYRDLLGPEIDHLQGVKTLFIVPDGPLESLPLSVLVTQAPVSDRPGPTDYQKTAWLARRFATATLPTVSSLRILRATKKVQGSAPDPFVGFGDPVLGPSDAKRRGGLSPSEAAGWRPVDVRLLKQLPSLPETASELRTIADFLHAPPSALYLQERASIPNLFRGKMDHYRVVAFATHAEVANDSLQGLAEPAIVLTPPNVGSPENDGLLRASQVAQLSLNADWVVLSACDTAAPDGAVGSPGLSGLAKAFFYAGARALLVSHWEVPSRPAASITTGMFRELAAHPEIGRAEALRRSMMDLLDHPHDPHDVHPMAWAPFVVAGEGGAGR
jgi:CHAT domain-containing protein/tetratricopeptide (TPR) repeat protein